MGADRRAAGHRLSLRLTRRAAEWVKDAFEALGFPAKITTKGGVLADLGGENADDGLFLEAHSDTLGAMVAQIKAAVVSA